MPAGRIMGRASGRMVGTNSDRKYRKASRGRSSR